MNWSAAFILFYHWSLYLNSFCHVDLYCMLSLSLTPSPLSHTMHPDSSPLSHTLLILTRTLSLSLGDVTWVEMHPVVALCMGFRVKDGQVIQDETVEPLGLYSIFNSLFFITCVCQNRSIYWGFWLFCLESWVIILIECYERWRHPTSYFLHGYIILY